VYFQQKEKSVSGKRISDEIRNAIVQEDPSISHTDLARKYGISDVAVLTIRKKAGVWKPLRPGTRRNNLPAVRHPKPRPAHTPTLSNAHEPSVEIRFCLTQQGADNIWRKLGLSDKARALTAALQSALEEA
jgi:transposase-like protein